MELVEIREERPDDIADIRELNRLAFGQDQEGDIIDALRSNGAVTLSLVATLEGRVVGHILYSPITVGDTFFGAALGPMSVLPQYQRQGIGGRLNEEGKRRLENSGCPFIIVLGHPEYYPRFGFRPASTHGVRCEWEVPDDVFMLLILDPVRAQGISGLAKYRQEFSAEARPMSQIEHDRRIDYIEFPATNIADTKKFYSEVFGWEFTDYGPTYTSFSDGRLGGGFTTDAGVTAVGVLIVLYSRELEIMHDKVTKHGGKITRETFEFPGGRRFHFSDPNGNELAVWSDR
jgi:predicted N-acetyltransferase YhbS/predicted enzyme related to lactoylglutathione lyase